MNRILFLVAVFFYSSGALTQELAPPMNPQTAEWWYEKFGIDRPQGFESVRTETHVPIGSPVEGDGQDIWIYPNSENQLEISIAVNETDPDQLFVSFYEVGVVQPWFFSTDGGETWNGTGDPPLGIFQPRGDPVALFDLQHRAFYVTMAGGGGIEVARTSDLGDSWSISSIDAGNLAVDKPHAMTDLSGLNPGNVYAGWSDFTGLLPTIVAYRSTDNGDTWIDDHTFDLGGDGGQGANIATGPNGEIYLAFANYDNGELPETGMRFAKSTDGGATWSNAIVAFPISGIRESAQGLPEFNGTRVNSFPSMSVDRSSGPRRGWIYIVYADKTSGKSDIHLQVSSDGGSSWTGPFTVNSGPGDNQRWFPSVAVDPVSGHVYVSYYNMNGGGFLTTRYLSYSTNGEFAEVDWEHIQVSEVYFTPRSIDGANGFMGDYYETSAHKGVVWTTWSDDRPETQGDFQAFVSKTEFLVDVTVHQQLSTKETIDKIDRWENGSFESYDAPKQFEFIEETSEILRGTLKVIKNKSGQEEKYNNWNGDSYVVNHQDFDITSDVSQLRSNLEPTHSNVIIRNELTDIPTDPPNDEIEFRDPWLRDLDDQPYGQRNRGQQESIFHKLASPFNPRTIPTSLTETDYKGVFLRQEDTPGLPHYSVRALEEPVPGFSWIFLGWLYDPLLADLGSPNNNESTVVFLEDGAVVSAEYKVRLGSSTGEATSPNSQRRIIRDTGGAYHMVYESGNEIWYSKSTNGLDWTDEFRLSENEPSYLNRTPSLTVEEEPHQVIVVWETYVPDNSEHDVVARTIDPATGEIGNLEPISATAGGTVLDFDMMPVVGSGPNAADVHYSMCAWFDGYDNTLKGSVRNNSTGAWTPAVVIRSGIVSQFSLTPLSPGGHQSWGLAWTEEGTLYYMGIPINATIVPGPIDIVAQGSVNVEHLNPSIAHGLLPLSSPAVAWESWKPELTMRVIKYREHHKGNGWSSSIKVWKRQPGPSDYQTPSLSENHQSVPNDVALTWRRGSSQLVYVKRESNVWGQVTSLATGLDPMISVGWTNPQEEQVIHTTTSGPPYAIEQNTISFSQQQRSTNPHHSMTDWIEGRGGRLCFDLGCVELIVLQARLDDVPLSFEAVPDTVRIKNLTDFTSYLRTGQFQGLGTLFLELQYGGSGVIPSDFFAGIVLRDAFTNELLSQVRLFGGTGDTTVTLRIPLSLDRKMVRLGIEPLGGVPQAAAFEIERWFLVEDDTVAFMSPTISEVVMPDLSSIIPSEYELHNAYPNPFNPTTTIKYDLPTDGHVSLKVYDILGKEVLTLVNGTKQAGYHQVTLDASNLPSGMYFYRLTAGQFVSIKKLLLVK